MFGQFDGDLVASYSPAWAPEPGTTDAPRMEAESLAADEYAHDWANLTEVTMGACVNHSHLFFDVLWVNSGIAVTTTTAQATTPSACYYPFPKAARLTRQTNAAAISRLTIAKLMAERHAGENKSLYVGFECVGQSSGGGQGRPVISYYSGTILASLPNFCGIGIDGGDDMLGVQ